MSTRCKACDAQLTRYDFLSTKNDDVLVVEDLCVICRGFVYSEDFLNTHEYQHEHLTENWYKFRIYDENS